MIILWRPLLVYFKKHFKLHIGVIYLFFLSHSLYDYLFSNIHNYLASYFLIFDYNHQIFDIINLKIKLFLKY